MLRNLPHDCDWSLSILPGIRRAPERQGVQRPRNRDRRKLHEIVGKLQAIREELRELEQAEETIVRQVAHSAGHALNWIIA